MTRPALLLVFLLGIWCGATPFRWQVAIQNFTVANGLAESDNTGFNAVVSELSTENLRAAVRYQASEVNRLFFDGWGWAQLPIALLAVFLAWKLGDKFILIAISIMTALTLFLQFYVVPETIRIGRLIDFISDGELAAETEMFWTLHHTYTGLDMSKLVVGLVAVFLLVRKH